MKITPKPNLKFALAILMLAPALSFVGCSNDQAKDKQDMPVADAPKDAGQDNGAICTDFGPQTPRDIDSKAGTNPVTFPVAPAADKLNLCNIHFHNGAEHKAKAFSLVNKIDGKESGFQCAMSQELSEAERAPYAGNACKGVAPGDTIEVHWVHSSCDVSPGKGLGSCLTDDCQDPSLRVETQVFTVVNDPNALDFAEFTTLVKRDGLNQAKAIPSDTGTPVQFLGSTTGPKYNDSVCSPMKVTWSVRPQCAKVNIASLSKWCEGNVFKEDHAHGVRKLVTPEALLSPIQ